MGEPGKQTTSAGRARRNLSDASTPEPPRYYHEPRYARLGCGEHPRIRIRERRLIRVASARSDSHEDAISLEPSTITNMLHAHRELPPDSICDVSYCHHRRSRAQTPHQSAGTACARCDREAAVSSLTLTATRQSERYDEHHSHSESDRHLHTHREYLPGVQSYGQERKSKQ